MKRRDAIRFGSAAVLAVCAGCAGDAPSTETVPVREQQHAHVAADAADAAVEAAEAVEAVVASEDEESRRLAAARGLVGPGDVEPGVFVWSDPGFRQKYFGTNFRDFEVLDEVLDGAGEWIGKVHARRADFDVMRVASARQDVLAMAGFAESGDFVLQRWTLQPTGKQGDSAAHPSALVEKRFVVAELYRGPLATGIRGLDFDAEQRFILALVQHETATTLYSFDNAVGAVPRMITDSTRLPALATMRDVQKFDHRKLGRVWRLGDFPAMSRSILLIDADNDGQFDGDPMLVEQDTWEAGGMNDFSLWNPLQGS